MTQWQRRALCARATASLQRLEPQPVRAGVVAQAAPLVFLVFAVVALEELHVRVALAGEDMRRDAVQAPPVMRDHESVARALKQRAYKRSQGFDVQDCGRIPDQPTVTALHPV